MIGCSLTGSCFVGGGGGVCDITLGESLWEVLIDCGGF